MFGNSTTIVVSRIPLLTRAPFGGWEDIMKLARKFRNFGSCQVKDRSSLFWKDNWSGVLAQRFPRCFSYVKDKIVSVQEVMKICWICSASPFLNRLSKSFKIFS